MDPEIYVDDELLLTIGTEAEWSSDNEDVATVITTEDGRWPCHRPGAGHGEHHGRLRHRRVAFYRDHGPR